jgi:hypothetical protein
MLDQKTTTNEAPAAARAENAETLQDIKYFCAPGANTVYGSKLGSFVVEAAQIDVGANQYSHCGWYPRLRLYGRFWEGGPLVQAAVYPGDLTENPRPLVLNWVMEPGNEQYHAECRPEVFLAFLARVAVVPYKLDANRMPKVVPQEVREDAIDWVSWPGKLAQGIRRESTDFPARMFLIDGQWILTAELAKAEADDSAS